VGDVSNSAAAAEQRLLSPPIVSLVAHICQFTRAEAMQGIAR
jgi:hypothetical protein